MYLAIVCTYTYPAVHLVNKRSTNPRTHLTLGPKRGLEGMVVSGVFAPPPPMAVAVVADNDDDDIMFN